MVPLFTPSSVVYLSNIAALYFIFAVPPASISTSFHSKTEIYVSSSLFFEYKFSSQPQSSGYVMLSSLLIISIFSILVT